MERISELLSWRDPIRTGASLIAVNLCFFLFWLFDMSVVSLGAIAGMLTIVGIKISSMSGVACCSMEPATMQQLLLAAFEPLYVKVNDMVDAFRRFVQLRLYTKRVVAGWAVILVLGSMFSM